MVVWAIYLIVWAIAIQATTLRLMIVFTFLFIAKQSKLLFFYLSFDIVIDYLVVGKVKTIFSAI